MTVRTRVQVILDIKTEACWGDDCTIAQVKKQSLDSANQILMAAIEKNNRITIISKVECLTIIMNGVKS